MAERDRLGERLVERQGGRERTRDLRHLDRVRQPRDVVVVLGVHEDLGLVLQAPERLAVQDPVAVPLEDGPHPVRWLRARSPA